MKIPFYTFGLAVTVLFTLLLVAGCTQSQIPAEPENKSAGPTPTKEEQPVRISFQEGLSLAEESLIGEGSGPATAYPVYFAQAQQVDSDGKAGQWIFGIRKDDKNFFVVVKPDSRILQPYPMDLPEQEITSTSVIDPARLIEKNRQLFTNAGAQEPLLLPEMELSEGFYTVTVSMGSGNAVMMFDAVTGEPVD